MAAFIQLTTTDGEPAWFNIDHIVGFWRLRRSDGTSYTGVITSVVAYTERPEAIQETPEEILAAIRDASLSADWNPF